MEIWQVAMHYADSIFCNQKLQTAEGWTQVQVHSSLGSRTFMDSANLRRAVMGSEPGESTKMSGVVPLLAW